MNEGGTKKASSAPDYEAHSTLADRVQPDTRPADENPVTVKQTNAASGFSKSARNSGAKPASKQDLVELHNRMVKMFTTLNQGLSEAAQKKASEEREVLTTRLDQVEESINHMEGMLRIELAPKLREIVREELEDQWLTTHARPTGRIFRLFAILAAVACGVAFSDQLLAGMLRLQEFLLSFTIR